MLNININSGVTKLNSQLVSLTFLQFSRILRNLSKCVNLDEHAVVVMGLVELQLGTARHTASSGSRDTLSVALHKNAT